GLYISDHPLNPYKSKLTANHVRPISEILESKSEQERFNIGGIIASAKKIVTKTGKPMLFVRIADFNSSIEVVVFPNTYEQTQALWNEGAAVLINGKISLRDNEPKIICDQAALL
ncbi:MAG: OB-fold nucleic acid binding domain-containing protein, partial [Patescibacteria group bacterium]